MHNNSKRWQQQSIVEQEHGGSINGGDQQRGYQVHREGGSHNR